MRPKIVRQSILYTTLPGTANDQTMTSVMMPVFLKEVSTGTYYLWVGPVGPLRLSHSPANEGQAENEDPAMWQ